jgi:acetyltransferase-like isoleucine patch superfamily enzyme
MLSLKHLFTNGSDRIGPDFPLTHVLLFNKFLMRILCKRKLQYFGIDAEVRPFSYLVGCSKISIGNGTVIRPGSVLMAEVEDLSGGSIVIEDNVLLGGNCSIYASNHEFRDRSKKISGQGHKFYQDVRIESGSWIGANVIILPGVVIGQHSVVGAGSVVTKSIPPFRVAVGNPAKIIKCI